MSSILEDVKAQLGDMDWNEAFDKEIIDGVNSALMALGQIGVGPPEGFKIYSDAEEWEDFIGDRKDLEAIKTYVFINTKLVFDTPSSSFVTDALKRKSDEYEWRAHIQSEFIKGCDQNE